MIIKFNKKDIEVEVKECRGLWKAIGLMFSNKKDAKALFFDFKKPVKNSIHSLFCPNFLAVWLRNKKVVDYEFVKKTRLFISPSSVFDSLVEIPLNKRYKKAVDYFTSHHYSTTKNKNKDL